MKKFEDIKSISDIKGKIETVFIQTHFCNKAEGNDRMTVIKKHEEE